MNLIIASLLFTRFQLYVDLVSTELFCFIITNSVTCGAIVSHCIKEPEAIKSISFHCLLSSIKLHSLKYKYNKNEEFLTVTFFGFGSCRVTFHLKSRIVTIKYLHF